MIPALAIADWANTAGWPNPDQLEQDLTLARLINLPKTLSTRLKRPTQNQPAPLTETEAAIEQAALRLERMRRTIRMNQQAIQARMAA